MESLHRLKNNLDNYDISYLIGYVFLWLYYANIVTPLTAGGLLLVFGAWVVYKGEIFISIMIYLLADVMWLINAYNYNDYDAMFFISLGMLLGILATFKMHIGIMAKSLMLDKKN